MFSLTTVVLVTYSWSNHVWLFLTWAHTARVETHVFISIAYLWFKMQWEVLWCSRDIFEAKCIIRCDLCVGCVIRVNKFGSHRMIWWCRTQQQNYEYLISWSTFSDRWVYCICDDSRLDEFDEKTKCLTHMSYATACTSSSRWKPIHPVFIAMTMYNNFL